MKFKALLVCMLLPVSTYSMDVAKSFVKPLSTFIASWLTVLLTHEAGHAVAGKLLFNHPINIHLAPNPSFSTKDEILTSVGPLHIHGIPLFGAVSVPTLKAKTRQQAIINQLKMIAFGAAGPLAGTLGGLAVGKVLELMGLVSRIPFLISMLNLLNLVPISFDNFVSDGLGIWQDIKHIKYLLTARKTIYDVA